jgi:hypothetical protein
LCPEFGEIRHSHFPLKFQETRKSLFLQKSVGTPTYVFRLILQGKELLISRNFERKMQMTGILESPGTTNTIFQLHFQFLNVKVMDNFKASQSPKAFQFTEVDFR